MVKGSEVIEGNLQVKGNGRIDTELTVADAITLNGVRITQWPGANRINLDDLTYVEVPGTDYNNQLLCSHISYDTATKTLTVDSFAMPFTTIVPAGADAGHVTNIEQTTSGAGLRVTKGTITESGSGTYVTGVSFDANGNIVVTRGD